MIPKADVDKIHAFISQLTVTESPDSRESDPNRRYIMIEPGMAISKLHANYVEWLKNNHPGVAAVSLSKFREIYKNWKVSWKEVLLDRLDWLKFEAFMI